MTTADPSPRRAALDSAAFDALRAPAGPYSRIDVVEETGSTNADLVADSTAGDRSALIATHQSQGKGRLGRGWSAPARSSLAVSIKFAPERFEDGAYGWLSMLCALSLVSALEARGVNAAVKWPNDVLIASPDGGPWRKVAGLLAQLVPPVAADQRTAVVVGAGINVNVSAQELPVPTATSLTAAGYAASLDAVACDYLAAVDREYSRLLAAGTVERSGLRDRVAARMATIGVDIKAELPGGEALEATATGLALDGGLDVRTVAGERRVLHAADVVHVRRSQGGYA
ncbi:biotin--[acetyl-CoA-carboxylase] ligase [Zhihengliuella flava]|uniref:BirA family biotin operon repressor/biotin-[acetyl-CoA-carboxylase] ligase n=1 Tax=Zhihengliuella flava TaxID=1285193 RepID=A0A931D7N2_9MICC|nr:biotin--[acetyl-CoA-carboxylase] ligase [Zhihengliuella flava]MBG6083917.1 BirA family biotin operon repressor/biotin-[acetyl-CoA-carboxylase] ligase [Zhihengliuella flava]